MEHVAATRVARFGIIWLVVTHALRAFALVAVVGSLAVPTQAVAQSFVFTSVTIEGNQRIEPNTILSFAGIARGQPVSAAQLNDASQRILASGLFETVEVEPRGSTLFIRVVELPTVNRIAIEGNRRIDDEDLLPILGSQVRRVFNPQQAETDAQAISEAYAQQGRLAARVQPKVIRRSENRVDLIFEVFEGGVTEIERIAIVGNQAYSDRRLRRVLGTKQATLLRAVVRSDTFIEDRIAFDRQLLNDFYASRGYVDFRITGVNAELAQERDGVFVTFSVEEGQQFRFGEITVDSTLPDVDPDVFQAAVKVKPGVVYSPSLVENDIARLERQAIREGLRFIRVEPRITRNDRELTLDVTFEISRGPRVFVERIDIEGNTTTLDRVIRRQFDLVEGDPFNPRAIRQSAERIRALGFFANVDVQAREGSTPQQVVVDVDVEEQPTGSLSFGGSFSTDSGIGLAISFSERNFLGRGQSLGFNFNTSADSRQYGINFFEPAFLSRDVGFGLALSYTETDSDDNQFDTAVGVFRPSIRFPLSENTRLSLRYQLRQTDILDVDQGATDVGDLIKAEAAEGARFDSGLGYTLSYDTRRSGLNPNAGVLLEFGQDFTGLGGDGSYIRSTVRAVAQTLAFNEEVTLRASFEGGALNMLEGDSRVLDRFRLSSSQMRGFRPGGIGPRERAGDVDDSLGGNFYAVARFEAEFSLGLPEEYGITGGLFYDVGSLWGLDSTNANVLYDDFSARHVIGVSLFWDSALGPLRINLTDALVAEEHDEPRSFELTVSTQF